MQKILKLLTESGYPLIEEADSILNVLHEVCFSLGKRVPPKVHELRLLSEIYGLLYESPALKKLTRLLSDPSPDMTVPMMTEQHYREAVQKPLALALIEHMQKMNFG